MQTILGGVPKQDMPHRLISTAYLAYLVPMSQRRPDQKPDQRPVQVSDAGHASLAECMQARHIDKGDAGRTGINIIR